MDEALFEKLLEKLDKLSRGLESFLNKDTSLTKEQKTGITSSVKEALLEDRNDVRVQGNEKRRIQKIAKIYKTEFKDLFENLEPNKEEEGIEKSKALTVTFDKKTFRGIESTIKKVIPDIAEAIGKVTKEKTAKKGGVLGFLGDLIGGAFGFLGSFNKLIPLLLTAGGIALAFYIVKNIEKIAKSIDMVLKSGKQNLPDILDSLRKNLFPFWDDFTDTAIYFFDRTLDTIDSLLNQLPVLFDLLLKNIPVIRQEIVGFLNDMNDLGKKLSENSFYQNLLFLFSLSLPVGLIAAIAAITKPLRVLNAAATAALVYSLGYYFNSFKTLEEISWETIGKATAAIGGLFGVLFFTSKMGPTFNDIKPFLVAGGVGAGIIFYLKGIKAALEGWDTINWETIGKAGTALGALGVGLVALGKFGAVLADPLVLAGLGVFFLGGAAVAGSIYLIGKALEEGMPGFEGLRDLFKSYSEMNGSNLLLVAGGISALVGALTLQSFTGVTQTLANTFTNFWGKLTGQKSALDIIKDFEKIDGDKLDRNAKAIEHIFKALGSGGTDSVKNAVENLNKLKFDKLGNIASVPAPTQPGKEQGPFGQLFGNKTRVAQDFLSRPNQPPIMFSSEDNILAFKSAGVFDPLKDQIAESYKNVEKALKQLVEQQKKGTFETTVEVKKQTTLLEKIAELNQILTEEGNNVSMVNTAVNNNLINVDSYTSTSFRNRVGLQGPTVYA